MVNRVLLHERQLLPDVWAGDPDHVARFRREVQVLASLNHPPIAQIYASKTTAAAADPAHTNTTSLGTDLVKGPTLADRVGREGQRPGSASAVME